MVNRVRAVYSGLLDMHYSTADDFFGSGSDHLWDDLDLDVVGISAYFPLTDTRPSTVLSVESLQASYEQIFQQHLIPLAERHPKRPVVFLEYGAVDEAPSNPADFQPFVFSADTAWLQALFRRLLVG